MDHCLKAQRYLQLWCGSSVVHKLSYRQNSYSASLQKTSVFMQMTQSCICQKDLIRAFSSCDIEWHFQNMCPICWGNYLWSLPWIEKHCFDPVFSGRGIVQETFVSMFDYRDIKNPQHFDAWAQRLQFTPTQCSGPITVFSTVWSHIHHWPWEHISPSHGRCIHFQGFSQNLAHQPSPMLLPGPWKTIGTF